MTGAVFGILLGGFFVINGVLQWARLLRWFSRRRHARAVIVGGDERTGKPGQATQHAARFRFMDEHGRVIESTSGFSSPFRPKPGAKLNVVYDPKQPQWTSERTGVHLFKVVVIGPVFIVGGAAIVTVSYLNW